MSTTANGVFISSIKTMDFERQKKVEQQSPTSIAEAVAQQVAADIAEERRINGETLRTEHYAALSGFQHVSWRWVRALCRASRADAILCIAEAMRCYHGKRVQDVNDRDLVSLSSDRDFTCHRDNMDSTLRMLEEVIFFRNLETGLVHTEILQHMRDRYVPARSVNAQDHKGLGTAAHYAQQDYGAVSTENPINKPTSKKAQRQ